LTPILSGSGLQTGETGCTNKAEFVKDVTIDDSSNIKPGQYFTKIWRLRNVGTCVWSPKYALVFVDGDQMNGLSPKLIGEEVQPGETIDLSIDLIAPQETAPCQGNWMLQDEEGNVFGTGFYAQDYFWVSISVGRPNIGRIFGGCGGGG
jgi:hypothetical protein